MEPPAPDGERAVADGTPDFTLWELLWTLAIVGIVLGLGVPSFGKFVLDARRTADINAFVLAVQLARSEAAKRGRPVVVCPSADCRRCGDQELRYRRLDRLRQRGRLGRRSARQRSPCSTCTHPALMGTISAIATLFEFRPY